MLGEEKGWAVGSVPKRSTPARPRDRQRIFGAPKRAQVILPRELFRSKSG
jgi:hypothetical protein